MSRQFIGVVTAVNTAKIRREQHNGREHIVVPSYTLPDDVVMNGGLYPREEIEKSYRSLENKLAPIGHPTVNGQFVSAFTPEALHGFHAGAWNRNVKREGNRIYLEKWIDAEFAANTEKGRELLEAIDAGEPIHTSTGIFLERKPVSNADGYSWVATNMDFDHDAILIGEIGAATPDQGVGMMVNVSEGRQLQATNAETVLKNGESARRSALEQAVRDRFATGGDEFVYVADYDDETVIVIRNGGASEAYKYSRDSAGKVSISDGGESVRRDESWVANMLERLGMVETARKLRGNAVNSDVQPSNPPSEASEMDAKELNDALEKQGAAIAANLATVMKPVVDALAEVAKGQTAMNEALTANTRAAEATKREVVAKQFGETVANSLTGNALDEMFARCKKDGKPAEDLTGNGVEEDGAPKYELPA